LGQKTIVGTGKAIFPSVFQMERIFHTLWRAIWINRRPKVLTWHGVRSTGSTGIAIGELPSVRPPPREELRREGVNAKALRRAGAAALLA
jgi:hypothetical protein